MRGLYWQNTVGSEADPPKETEPAKHSHETKQRRVGTGQMTSVQWHIEGALEPLHEHIFGDRKPADDVKQALLG